MYFHSLILKTILKKTIALTVAVSLVLLSLYIAFEPAMTEADTASDTVTVTQVVTGNISISNGADITMTPLSSTQDTAVGSATWGVTTNNVSGYTLTVHASTTPALKSGTNSFADYATSTPTTWSVPAGEYDFGFSAHGSDTPTATWGTDTDCIAAANVPSAGLKWSGYKGSTDIQIAAATAPTGVGGNSTTMCVATEQKGVFAPSGSYSATITATAVSS